MKRILSTIVLFILLILTVAALSQLDTPTSTNALGIPNKTAAVKRGTY